MNENEISRIAAAISDLRPDWPAASIRTLLKSPELKNKPRRDVAVALTWVACEADTKTPKRVLEAGPWWRAAAVEAPATANRPPKADEACPTHGGYRDNCPGCAADRLVGDQTTRPAPARLGPTDEFRQARAALASELLSHPQHEATDTEEAS